MKRLWADANGRVCKLWPLHIKKKAQEMLYMICIATASQVCHNRISIWTEVILDGMSRHQPDISRLPAGRKSQIIKFPEFRN